MEQKCQLTIAFTNYYGLIKSIPPMWIEKIRIAGGEKEEDDTGDYKWIDQKLDAAKPAKMVYMVLRDEKFKPPSSKAEKWSKDLETELELDKLLNSLDKQRTCTINTKLRSFNYNFFMKNIPYGTRLVKMKIKDDSRCQECGCSEETLMHLYWSCPSTKRLGE